MSVGGGPGREYGGGEAEAEDLEKVGQTWGPVDQGLFGEAEWGPVRAEGTPAPALPPSEQEPSSTCPDHRLPPTGPPLHCGLAPRKFIQMTLRQWPQPHQPSHRPGEEAVYFFFPLHQDSKTKREAENAAGEMEVCWAEGLPDSSSCARDAVSARLLSKGRPGLRSGTL